MRKLTHLMTVLALAMAAAGAHAQVGLKRLSFPGSAADPAELQAAAWYPTSEQAHAMQFGPLEMTVAPGAPLPARRTALVLLSHGAGGNQWAQAWLAQSLAAQGYLVVALRHPHDHQDDSALQRSPGYFSERAMQISRLLDALAADASWGPVIDMQRIAVIGHSAGGATALALAGGHIDMSRLAAHCGPDGAGRVEDPAFCSLGGDRRTAETSLAPVTKDPRIRAAVAAVPVAVMFTPESLAAIDVPLAIENSAADPVLKPRFHGAAVCAAQSHAACTTTADAGHRAFSQAGMGREDGLPDFDKLSYQRAAAQRLVTFLAQALH